MSEWLGLDDIKSMSKDNDIRIAVDEIYTIGVDRAVDKGIDDWGQAEYLTDKYTHSPEYHDEVEPKEFKLSNYVEDNSDMTEAGIVTTLYSAFGEGYRDKLMGEVQEEHYKPVKDIV
jgi:hypothetical protein